MSRPQRSDHVVKIDKRENNASKGSLNPSWQEPGDTAAQPPGARHGSQPPLLLLLYDRTEWIPDVWNVDGRSLSWIGLLPSQLD